MLPHPSPSLLWMAGDEPEKANRAAWTTSPQGSAPSGEESWHCQRKAGRLLIQPTLAVPSGTCSPWQHHSPWAWVGQESACSQPVLSLTHHPILLIARLPQCQHALSLTPPLTQKSMHPSNLTKVSKSSFLKVCKNLTSRLQQGRKRKQDSFCHLMPVPTGLQRSSGNTYGGEWPI